MKVFLSIVIFNLIVLCGLNAQTNKSFEIDTISEEYYLKKYGVDDTSKALIKYHFLKMKQYKTPIYIGAGVILLTSLASLVILNNDSGFESLIVIPLAGAGLSGGLTAIGTGIQSKLELTREKLLNTLNYYNQTGNIPKRFNRRYARWRIFLQKKKHETSKSKKL